MRKLVTNKIFIGTVCLVLAAVLSFVLLPKLYEDETATVQVVVLNRTAEKGTVILKDLILGAQIAQNATLEEWKDRPAQVEVPRADLVATVRKMLVQ